MRLQFSKKLFLVVQLVAVALIGLCWFSSAKAQPLYWNVASGDWSDISNWSPNGFPDETEYIENGGTAITSPNSNIVTGILQISGDGSTLVINGKSFDIRGSLMVKSGGLLQNKSDFFNNQGPAAIVTIGFGGTFQNIGFANSQGGTIDVKGGSYQNTGRFHNQGGEVLVQNGGIFNTSGTFESQGGAIVIQNGGIFTSTGTLGLGQILDIGQPGMTGGTLTALALIGSGTAINLNQTDTFTFAMPIEGYAFITQSGTGTTMFSGANTFYGLTVLNSGTIITGSSTALGTGDLTINGGKLELRGASLIIGNLSGTGGTISLGNNTLTAGTFASTTFAGAIQGAGGLTKQGPGVLTLSGTISYTGATLINGGTLSLATWTSLSSSSGINLAADLTAFDISQGGNQTIQNLNGIAGSIVNLNANALMVAATGTTAVTGAFAGTIQGSGGSLILNGSQNTLVLTGANTYTGGTTINSGILRLGDGTTPGAALGTDGVTVNGAGMLVLDLASGESFTNDTANNNLIVLDGSSTNDYVVTGQITGTGSLVKSGTNTVTLTNSNTFSGGTTINSGNLVIGDGTTQGASVGTGNVAVNTGGQLTLNLANGETFSNATTDNGQVTLDGGSANNYTVASLISGTGSVMKSGANTVSLTNNNTYTGATTITAGTLALGAGGSIANSSGVNLAAISTAFDIAAAGNQTIKDLSGVAGSTVNLGSNTLTAGTGNSTTFAGAIQGSGGFTKQGAGTMTFSGANTYTGATAINAGTLALGAGGSVASSSGVNLAAIATAFDIAAAGNQTIKDLSGVAGSKVNLGVNTLTTGTANSTTFAGVIQGTGGLTKQGVGALTLAGANTYSGGTTLNEGSLVAGNGSAFGTGDLKVNGGTLDLNGMTVTVGSLSGSGGTITSGAGGQLIVNEDIDPVFAGNITGATAMTYNGTNASNLILTGNNTYTGGTMITGGMVAAGSATSFGAGNVGFSGGTLTTGNGNHVINVGGNYTQTGGTLLLNLNGPGQGTGYDFLNVNGTAALGGALLVNVQGYMPVNGQTFTFVVASGGITGSFTSAMSNIPTLGISLQGVGVENDGIIIQLPFAPYAQTPNQRSVANYVDIYDQYYGGNSFPLVVAALNRTSVNPSTLAGALDQLTPTKFGNFTVNNVINNATFATQQFDSYLEGLRSGNGTFMAKADHIDASGLAMLNPNVDPQLAQLNSRLLAFSPASTPGLLSDSAQSLLAGTDMKELAAKTEPADLWNVFLQGNVVLGQSFSGSDTPYGTSTTGGMQVGFDYRFTPHFLAGLAFGYNHTNATLDTLGSNATVNSYAPTLFASYVDGGWYGNALVTYGFNKFNENRAINFGGFNGTANGSPSGRQQVFNLDGGYDFHAQKLTFGPTLGVQYTHFNVNNYTETGAPGANLAVSSQGDDSVRSRLGGHISYAAQIKNIAITPHLDVSWQHEYLNQNTQLYSSFSDVGTGSFAITTPNGSKDSALIAAGFNIEANKDVTVFVDYLAQAGQSNYFGQSVQAGVKIGF